MPGIQEDHRKTLCAGKRIFYPNHHGGRGGPAPCLSPAETNDFLGTQTRLGSQTRVGYAGWCTKGIGGCEGFTEGPQRNLGPRAVTPDTPGTAKNPISGRAVDETFHNHRNSGITRRTGGIRRRTPQCRRRTPRGMHRDRNGIRGTREPEENECGRQKNSLEFENRSNSIIGWFTTN